MDLLIVFISILVLVFLIIGLKLNPMLALLLVSLGAGLALGMPVEKVSVAITNGVGGTLGSMVMILGLGAMIGKLVEDSGAAKQIVNVLIKKFGQQNIQWAILTTGFMVGIPLFYNAGFVVLIPLVFAVAKNSKVPLLYVGIPMAASLSVTHGFLPPHPGPTALASMFSADLGKTLLYGLIISIPTSILAGIYFPRLIIKKPTSTSDTQLQADHESLPAPLISFTTALLPVFLITGSTLFNLLPIENNAIKNGMTFISDPTTALLFSLLFAVYMLGIRYKSSMQDVMNSCTEGLKSIAMIMMIIGAGGAFKQVLIDSGIGDTIISLTADFSLSPLIMGWLIAALLRVSLGSATVAGLTAAGIVSPLVVLHPELAELMVLAVGAGSLMFSHVNDTGFWMFKEYFNLSLKETFRTWTMMETLVSIIGIVGVLLLNSIING